MFFLDYWTKVYFLNKFIFDSKIKYEKNRRGPEQGYEFGVWISRVGIREMAKQALVYWRGCNLM